VDRERVVAIGGVLLLTVAALVTLVVTDEPDALVPDFVFEVASAEEIPSAVRAVYRPTGEAIRCVRVAEQDSATIIVSAYCPRRTVGDWAFFPID